MRRLALAAALVAAAIFAFEVAPTSEIWLTIVVGMLVLEMMSGIIWLLSPKFWREVATVRFWIVLAVLMLVSVASLKLR